MKIRVGLPLASVCLLAAASGLAQGEAEQWDGDYGAKASRRSDFTIGTSAGLGLGRASGYPNEIQRIGDPAYRSDTELGVGSGSAIWAGVAFNDYLSFGLGMGGVNLSGNDRKASAGAFLFHVDVYPLFDVHPALRDLAAFAHFGTGPLKITGGAEEADGGLMGYAEGGVSYEALRFWRFAFGPSASVLHMWSESATVTGALIGARLAFYGGP